MSRANGGSNSQPHLGALTLSLHAVPSAVTGLQVEDLHSTHSLQVSWEEARGVSDGYVLQLLDDRGSLVTNCSLAFGETRHRVEGLTAGRKYRVQVQTTSGGVHSQRVNTEARTCKTSCFCSKVGRM